MKIKSPCNQMISSTKYPKHVRECKICSSRWSDLLNGKYDKFLQKIVNEFDFSPSKIFKAVTENIMYISRSMQSELVKYMENKKIYPIDGKYICICGAKFKKFTGLASHKANCEEYKNWWNEILSSEIMDPNNIKEALETKGMDILEYVKQYGYDQSSVVYNYLRKLVDKMISENTLNYKKQTFKDVVKNKKYVSKRQKTIKEKYGVENISQLDWVKEKKKQTFLKNYGETHWLKSDEGKKYLKNIVYGKYGVGNISQLDWVQKKKEETFKKHYGETNIFKKRDIIVKSWEEKLGVSNPVFHKEINEKRLLRSLKNYGFGYDVELYGKTFRVLCELEYKFLQIFLDPFIINDVKVNEVILNIGDRIYLTDIVYKNKVSLEIKSQIVDVEKAYELSKYYNYYFMIFYYDKSTVFLLDDDLSLHTNFLNSKPVEKICDILPINNIKKLDMKPFEYVYLAKKKCEEYISKKEDIK